MEGGDSAQSAIRVSLNVDRSNVQVLAAQDLEIRAIDSYLNTISSRGSLTLHLQGGTAEIEEHEGMLAVNSRGSEIWLAETSGNLVLAIDGGSLVARRGAGRCEGAVVAGSARLEEWRGAVDLAVDEATFEMLASTGASVKLEGERPQVLLEGLHGRVELNLTGGRVSGADLVGGWRITARDEAEITLDRLRGSVGLKLENGVTARVSEVSGPVQAEMVDSWLEMQNVQILQLSADRCEISATGIEYLNKVEVASSRLDLDLSTVLRNPRLKLSEGSEAKVTLKSPCGVRLESNEAFAPVDVTGCQLHTESQIRPRSNRRGIDGNRLVTLVAALSEDSSLEVEGLP